MRPISKIATAAGLALALGVLPVHGQGAADGAEGASGDYPVLRLLTTDGPIEVELFTDAAPEATSRLLSLADAGDPGFSLDFVQPYGRVTSTEIPAFAADPVPMEIDAVALGLDRQRIADAGQAMNVVQDELLAFRPKVRGTFPTETFRRWIETWRANRTSDFLVGLSRQELFEGFGHVYREGLASRPVERGSVVLLPDTPNQAQPKLVFSLADQPMLTGRWMVIGRVIQGLERLQALSAQPLAFEHDKAGPLARPVTVRSIESRDPLSVPGSTAPLNAD
ncbi:MAG: hypothetical protein AAGD06_08070 [Acidobacteriota bacterium]